MNNKLWFALLVSTFVHPAVAHSADYTYFDVPEALCGGAASYCYPVATGINSQGTVVGTYLDKSNITHGFYRTADGVFTSFDGPNGCSAAPDAPACTVPTGINDNGTIVGNSDSTEGFLLESSGTFLYITIPDAVGTLANAINASGAIAGIYYNADNSGHGFVRDPSGDLTTFDAPKISGAHTDGAAPTAVNSQGQIVGTYRVSYISTQGFLRSQDGYFTLLDVPSSSDIFTVTIDDGGQIYGTFIGPDRFSGFIRDPSGNYTVFNVPGSTGNTFLYAANDKGTAVGMYHSDPSRGTSRGFYRLKDGTFGSVQPPAAVDSFPLVINSKGEIAGYFVDAADKYHGFVRSGP